MASLDAVVTINGSNMAAYLEGVERNAQLCHPGQTAEIALSANAPHGSISPWHTLTITEQGVLVLTGVVESVSADRAPAKVRVVGRDNYKRALDYFLDDGLTTNGETVLYWVDYLCDLCGLSYEIDPSAESTQARLLSDAVPIGTRSVADALMSVCSYALWQMRVKPDGVLQFFALPPQPTFMQHNFLDVMAIERETSDEDVRTVVKIWGYDPGSGSALNYIKERPVAGVPQRIMALGHPNIDTLAKATELGDAALDQFASINRQTKLEIIGDPNISVGDTGAAELNGLTLIQYVTYLTSRLDNTGYTQSIVMGRRCPRLPSFPASSSGSDISSGSVGAIYVGSLNDLGRSLNFLTDDYTNWKDQREDITGTFGDMAVDPYDPLNTALAITTEGIWRTINAQNQLLSWTQIYTPGQFATATGKTWSQGRRILSTKDREGAWYAQVVSTGSDLFIGRALNGGDSWTWRNVGVIDPAYTIGFDVDQWDASRLWTGLGNGQIYVCANGEGAFSFALFYTVPDATTPVLNIAASEAARAGTWLLFIGGMISTGAGVYFKKSLGLSAAFTDITPSNKGALNNRAIAPYPYNGNLLYVLAGTTPNGNADLFFSDDGGVSYTLMQVLGTPTCLICSQVDPSVLFFLQGNEIDFSIDGGESITAKTGDWLAVLGESFADPKFIVASYLHPTISTTYYANAGYLAGGRSANAVATADKLMYSTEITTALTTANLSQARNGLGGVSNDGVAGYFAGGNTGAGRVATADKLTYSTEVTAAKTTANLSQVKEGLTGVSNSGTAGYFAGGTTGAVIVVADKLTYSTEVTAAKTTANLSQARKYTATASNIGTAGYFAGGELDGGGRVATADKLTYSTEVTAALTTANLSQARRYAIGVSNSGTSGYFAGGNTTDTVFVTTADKLTYATGVTAAKTTANLSQARNGLGSVQNDTIAGYLAGGYTTGYVATADKLTYSTEVTTAKTTANLSQARQGLAGVQKKDVDPEIPPTPSSDAAYFSGGYVSSYLATTDKLIYWSEIAAAQTSANLTVGRRNPAAASNVDTAGYFVGGVTTGNAVVGTADKLTYSTEVTATQPSANLSQARRGLGGLSNSNTAGYFAGGSTTFAGAFVTTADKLTYSTEVTAALTTANLSLAREEMASVSNDETAGYFVGGYLSGAVITALADKITYATEVSASKTSADLSVKRQAAGGISNSGIAGYMSGGAGATFLSWFDYTDKLWYSSDVTVNKTSADLIYDRADFGSASNSGVTGYFAGGTTGSLVDWTQKLSYSTDTPAFQSSAYLSQARTGLVGISRQLVVPQTPPSPPAHTGNGGYFCGGTYKDDVSTTEKVTYSTSITTELYSANLTQRRQGLAGVSNSGVAGYLGGGVSTAVYLSSVDKLTYSTEVTVAKTTANLSEARETLAGVSNSGVAGYFAGGRTFATYFRTADKLTYSTETTAAQVSARLTKATYALASVSNDGTAGYFTGGNTGNYTALTDKLTYSTENTATKTTANLSVARAALTGVSNSGTAGYFAGGNTVAGSYVAIADKLSYPTEVTAAQTSANLSQGRGFLAGVSNSGTSGYFAGGATDSGDWVARTDKLVYSTEITAVQYSAFLSTPKIVMGSVSANIG